MSYFDTLARLVLHKTADFSTIDITHLANEVLLVKIETEKGLITKKPLKE